MRPLMDIHDIIPRLEGGTRVQYLVPPSRLRWYLYILTGLTHNWRGIKSKIKQISVIVRWSFGKGLLYFGCQEQLLSSYWWNFLCFWILYIGEFLQKLCLIPQYFCKIYIKSGCSSHLFYLYSDTIPISKLVITNHSLF